MRKECFFQFSDVGFAAANLSRSLDLHVAKGQKKVFDKAIFVISSRRDRRYRMLTNVDFDDFEKSAMVALLSLNDCRCV